MKTSGYEATEVVCDNGIKAEWDNELWGIKISENNEEANRIKCSVNFEITLSNYIMYQLANDPNVVKEEHESTEQTLENAKIDYRYIGANPNNYICLESDGDCTDDELYRIVGVMPTQKDESGDYENRVKLVKNTTIGEYIWMGGTKATPSDWKTSTINKEVLNGTYWDEISEYQKYIGPAKWYLGHALWGETHLVFYQKERAETNNFIANVGLIYVSDYGYATSGNDISSRNSCLADVGANFWINDFEYCTENNWLTGSDVRWTISGTSNNVYVFMKKAVNGGSGGINLHSNSDSRNTYPSFYLKSTVKYLSGTGEASNPYRVTID